MFGHVEHAGPRASLLRELTLGELIHESRMVTIDGGGVVDPHRLRAAERASGAAFDEHVRAVLAEAGGEAVGAGYLRARVGGPRWKLLGALSRLVAAGVVERTGVTNGTRYRIAAEAAT